MPCILYLKKRFLGKKACDVILDQFVKSTFTYFEILKDMNLICF